ncbi:unnamed protein product, partial [Brassica oleracea var. botrytis]
MVLHLGPWRSHAWDQFLSQRRCLEVRMRRRITLQQNFNWSHTEKSLDHNICQGEEYAGAGHINTC